MRAAFADQPDLKWALQAEQLGTGHAVMQAMPAIPDDHQVLVLLGDVPLDPHARRSQRLVDERADGKLALLTALLDDATGYGRVLRDESGDVTRIVEHKDASDDERRVNEMNTGAHRVRRRGRCAAISQLENDNSQGEYYLTDVIAMAVAERHQGAGHRRRLADRGARHQRSRAARAAERALAAAASRRISWRAASTLADPERVDVRGEVTVGRDVFIDVGVVLEGKVVLGDRVHVGPYAVIADSTLGAGTRRAPAQRDERRRGRRRIARSGRSRACGRARCSPAT